MQPEAQAALRRLWLKQEQARYQQRVQAQPDDAQAWRQLARVCWEAGELESALGAFDRVLALQPADGEGLLGRSMACLALGRDEEALAASVQMLRLFPDHPDALLYQIEALRRLGRLTEALAACDRLLALPELPPQQRLNAFHSKATFQFQLNQREESLATVDLALTLAPHDPGFRLSRARLLSRLRRFAEALAEVESLAGVPEMQCAAGCVKARALANLGRFVEADAVLKLLRERYPHEALEREFEPWRLPDETPHDSLHKCYTSRGLYLIDFFNAQSECDWSDREKVLSEIGDLTADVLEYGFVAGMEPHRMLSLPIDPALQRAMARAQATAVAAYMAPIREKLPIQWSSTLNEGRLRIGYVSGDFRDHATAHLIRKLFRVHDRASFEIIGYSLRAGDGSHYWRQIAGACDQFVELSGLSNAEAAARIAADGVHVLVDLQGYTRFARPEIFALRPAPIQVSFLGYPGTLGADYIPYIIADRVVLPENLRPFFSEQPVYLPDCYQVNDDEQPIAATGFTRSDAGLPEDAFVYCCFNTPYKIDPTVFKVWMQILRQVPDSVLWLLAGTPRCIDHLRKAAHEQNVEPDRLIFAPRQPKPEHLERHRLADLFLDTFIVNAHTTASDALWAGLPMLTLRGATFQSRVCTSLLTALGLTELIAEDIGDYEARGVALAQDVVRLRTLRAALPTRCRIGPPFETLRFVGQLEQAFRTLWDGHAAGNLL